jgi:Tol biopolymer transport system component
MRHLIQTIAAILTLTLLGCVEGSGTEHGNVSIDVSPDGKSVVFSSADGDLFLFSIKSKSVTRLTSTDAIESVPAFAPDGKSIVYSASKDTSSAGCIYQIILADLATTKLTHDDHQSDFLPRYSPDGKKIVFGRAYRNRPYSMGGTIWDNWDICEMDADGKNVKRLTTENYHQLYRMVPKSDGSIVYSAGTDAVAYTITNGDRKVKQISSDSDAEMKPHAWASDIMISPDESTMVFASDRTRAFWYDVCISTDGNNATGLVGAKSRYNRYPDFAPDGERIIFMAGTKFGNGNRPIFSLWEVSTTGNAREIATDQLFTDPLNYKPTNAE